MSIDIKCLNKSIISEAKGHLALFNKLFAGLVHLLTGELVDVEALDNVPFTLMVDLDGEGVHNAFRGSVGVAVTNDSHAHVVSLLGSVPEIVHVIAGGIGSGGSR